ncbi:MAG: hypothetical protein EXS36_03135 [Pedosphaera sp.]|nr:hypothetical protein [Pedosphaera sp.]
MNRCPINNALTDATWLPIIAPPDFPSPDGWSGTSTGAPMSITDQGVSEIAQRFYQLEVAAP